MRSNAWWAPSITLSAALMAVGLFGCAPGEAEKTGGEGKESAGLAAPALDAKLSGKLEVAAFQGGYGIDFYESAAKEFKEKHPELEIEVWGNPRVWEQLRPRFIGGNPPDLVFPGWGMDQWALAAEGQLNVLDAALDGPADGVEGSWRDTFLPDVLALGKHEGKQVMLPFYINVQGWWYDPGVFQKNGWTPPKTHAELLALCEKIKAAGIAPITFQGQYPYYMLEGFLVPWMVSIGGPEVFRDCQNLVPGAWKNPAVLQAATMIKELQDKGYFQKGAVAMSHTESQAEFLAGRAAMIPCGTWLYSEMKNVMPPNAQMEFFLPPVVDGGKGDPTALIIGIEPWMVPTDAKNPEAAIALYRYMTSPAKAKQFVEQKGTLTAIKGSDEAQLMPVLVQPAKALRESKNAYSIRYRDWYKEMAKEAEDALTAMLNGQITPEGFCDRIEASAEKTRNDDSIPKYKVD